MIKRTIAILLTAFLLCACSAKEKTPDPQELARGLEQPFESTVSIRYKELDATAKIARESPGYCKVTFASPKELADMAVEFTAEKVNIEYKKLCASFSPGSLPGAAVSKLLVSAIDSATKEDGVRLEYKDEVLTVTGELEDGTFVMQLDPHNGNVIKLSVPADEFEAEFRDFHFLA